MILNEFFNLYQTESTQVGGQEQLQAELEQLQSKFDPHYQHSDDYTFWSKQNRIAQRISVLKQLLAKGDQGVAEGSEQEKPIKKSDWFDPTDMRSPEKQKAAYLNHLAAQKKNKNIKEQGVAEGSPEDSKIGGRYTPAEFDAKLARIKARHQANPANPADLVARLQAAYKKQKPVAEHTQQRKSLLKQILKG